MYRQSSSQAAANLSQAVEDLSTNSDRDVEDHSFLQSDVPVPKILRARALKSVSWLLNRETLPELAIVVSATRPAESLMAWLFEQQQVPWAFLILLMMYHSKSTDDHEGRLSALVTPVFFDVFSAGPADLSEQLLVETRKCLGTEPQTEK